MATIATANFPDSDNDDEDFEVPGGEGPEDEVRQRFPSESPAARRKRQRRTEEVWNEMQKDEIRLAKRWVKRPCPDPALFLEHGVEDSLIYSVTVFIGKILVMKLEW